MKNKSLIIACLLFGLTNIASQAQNGSNSSYSRYGLGLLADQSQTSNRGMGGVAYGLRDGARINALNPASYSCIDSLSFIFDTGITLQSGHFTKGNNSVNARNTTLSNINAAVRLHKGLGMSIGFMPYTTIGYTYRAPKLIGTTQTGELITSSTAYSGNGGLQMLYMGFGWNPVHNLNIGFNAGYMWGTYEHLSYQSFSENGTQSSIYSNQNQVYSSEIRTYKLDFGIQYPVRLTNQDWLTFGATYSLGHKIGGNTTLLRYTSVGDTLKTDDGRLPTAKKAFDIPHTIGGGLSWRHKNTVLIAADYTYTRWADCRVPTIDGAPTNYVGKKGSYNNNAKYAIGIEYVPSPKNQEHNYIKTIRYRAGASYASPYLRVNGLDGPKEYRASIGLGLPLQARKLSGRSIINLSAEWLSRRPSDVSMIKENYFIVNLGVTFNERWFMKWKFN